MGGYSSGRYRTRNQGTVDAALRLDIRRLRAQGYLKPGSIVSGPQRWTWVATGEEVGSVSVSVHLASGDGGTMTVSFASKGQNHHQSIQIESRPMPYGGWRYYFVCPKSGRRCEILCLCGGVFASRQAHRLAYQSQSDDWLDRMRERAEKLDKKLRPNGSKGRPRGRRRERILEAWIEADSFWEQAFAQMVARRFRGLL